MARRANGRRSRPTSTSRCRADPGPSPTHGGNVSRRMFDTFRSVALATAVNVGVFVTSAWWSGDLDDRVAADIALIALIALNTLPLLLIWWNPVVAVVIMTVAYPLW